MLKINMVVVLVTAALIAVGCEDEVTGELLPAPPVDRAVVFVPEDYSTLQAGIDAAEEGDTVLVAAGTHSGQGFRDIQIRDKTIVVMSEDGPAATVLRLDGTDAEPHFGFNLIGPQVSDVIIDGFTITGGYTAHGTGMFFTSTSPTIRNCIFSDNIASVSGGAVRCKGSSPRFINCTFVNNSAPTGGGIYVVTSSPTFENCIIAFSRQSEAVCRAGSTSEPVFICSNLFGNAAGDWIDFLSDQLTLENNFSADPVFCDRDNADYHLRTGSPSSAEESPCGELVGALGIGCDTR